MSKPKYWYIKERHNPQFKKPYYIALGNIRAIDAKKHEDTLYGFNIIHRYNSENEYRNALKDFNAKLGEL